MIALAKLSVCAALIKHSLVAVIQLKIKCFSHIWVYVKRMKNNWVLSYSLSVQLNSDQTNRMSRMIWIFAGCMRNTRVLSYSLSALLKSLIRLTGCLWLPEFSLDAWGIQEFLATHWKLSKISDQTNRMSRVTWIFAGCMRNTRVLSYSLSAQLNLWSD